MRLRITVFAVALYSTLATVQLQASAPVMDSVYIRIVECYVPTAAFARYSESNVVFLKPSSDDSTALSSIFSDACKEVSASLNPEMLLKTRLGRHFVSRFTVEEAIQILSACSAGAGFTNKDLYQRFDTFMKTFQDLFDSESDYVWLKYVGSVTTRVAEKYDDHISTLHQSKDHDN